jgi:hypothetical protein
MKATLPGSIHTPHSSPRRPGKVDRVLSNSSSDIDIIHFDDISDDESRSLASPVSAASISLASPVSAASISPASAASTSLDLESLALFERTSQSNHARSSVYFRLSPSRCMRSDSESSDVSVLSITSAYSFDLYDGPVPPLYRIEGAQNSTTEVEQPDISLAAHVDNPFFDDTVRVAGPNVEDPNVDAMHEKYREVFKDYYEKQAKRNEDIRRRRIRSIDNEHFNATPPPVPPRPDSTFKK